MGGFSCYNRSMKNPLEPILTKNMLVILLVGFSLFGLIRYIDYRFDSVQAQIQNINSDSTAINRALDSKLKSFGEIFLSTLSEEQKNNSSLKSKLNKITDTVEGLEKLSTTDPELLKKYSKVYFLNEHYVPISLSNIDEEYLNPKSTNFQIHSDVLSHLEDLMDESNDDGLALQVLSGYRSFGTQSSLKSTYAFTYGAGTANQFSADQGYSEHQLGTAVDFTTAKTFGMLDGFDSTPEYTWLLDNAYRYGFVISYPAGNTYYKFEPWHWRFVGEKLARKLHRDNIYFYDMDQRTVDSYLANIFD